jgi:hypothetical protein
MELSTEYLYGWFFENIVNITYFYINKKNAYKICNNVVRKCSQTDYEIIKNKLLKRIEYIYNKTQFLDKPKKPKKTKSIIKKKGGSLDSIFLLPDEKEEYSTFKTNLTKINRGYISGTSNPNDVKAVLLCFFHINDFNMSNFGIEPHKDSYIITEQATIDKENYEKTISDIRNNIKINPVYLDIEYTYNKANKKLERQFYLSDGNHRIYALKLMGYNGMVPAIVCDYLPSSFII